MFLESEDGHEYGGESGLGIMMKGYQPGEVSNLSLWCRTNKHNIYWFYSYRSE